MYSNTTSYVNCSSLESFGVVFHFRGYSIEKLYRSRNAERFSNFKPGTVFRSESRRNDCCFPERQLKSQLHGAAGAALCI